MSSVPNRRDSGGGLATALSLCATLSGCHMWSIETQTAVSATQILTTTAPAESDCCGWVHTRILDQTETRLRSRLGSPVRMIWDKYTCSSLYRKDTRRTRTASTATLGLDLTYACFMSPESCIERGDLFWHFRPHWGPCSLLGEPQRSRWKPGVCQQPRFEDRFVL